MGFCQYCGEEFGHKSMCPKRMLEKEDFELKRQGGYPLRRR